MNTETLNTWAAQYNEKKTLPSKTVPCTTEGCTTETTLCSNNLHNRVTKFGGIFTLLSTFKCRACSKADKPAKAANKSARKPIQSLVKATVDPTVTDEVAPATMTTEELLSVFDE